MIRTEAIELIMKYVAGAPTVSANGYESRDLFQLYDKDSNFYMLGSMGLASSIALGVAIKNPKKRIFVFDGDGNILMNLGSITTIGAMKQKNLVHIVFDNQTHESTGGQPTITKRIRIENIAKAANYTVFRINSKKHLEKTLKKIGNKIGPIMILVKIEKSTLVSKRVQWSGLQIRKRFMNFLRN